MNIVRIGRVEWRVASRQRVLWFPWVGWTAVLLIPMLFYHVTPANVLRLAIPSAKLFVACTVILIVGQEFTWGTARQHVIDGLSRNALLATQILLAISVALLYTLVLFGLGVADHFSSGSQVHPQLGLLLAGDGTVLIGYAALGLCVAFLTRRSAIGLPLFVAYELLGEALIGFVMRRAGGHLADAAPYLPLTVMSRLAHTHGLGQPASAAAFDPMALMVQMGRGHATNPFAANALSMPVCYSIIAAYVVVACVIAWTLLRQRDL